MRTLLISLAMFLFAGSALADSAPTELNRLTIYNGWTVFEWAAPIECPQRMVDDFAEYYDLSNGQAVYCFNYRGEIPKLELDHYFLSMYWTPLLWIDLTFGHSYHTVSYYSVPFNGAAIFNIYPREQVFAVRMSTTKY